MSKNKSRDLSRKCAPVLALASGAAVCLSSGGAHATSGNVAASNAGNYAFGDNVPINLFNYLAGVIFSDHGGANHAHFKGVAGSIVPAVAGSSTVQYLGAGVTIGPALSFVNNAFMYGNHTNSYIAVRFNASGTKYGWLHVVSADAGANNLTIDTWAYDQTGGTIKTLDESITPKTVALSDGRVKLNWSNANEAGVARYEVQAKGANGAWAAVDSSTPGEGSYASTVASGEYRLVVENSDGSSRSINF